jgi:hypothetical protein
VYSVRTPRTTAIGFESKPAEFNTWLDMQRARRQLRKIPAVSIHPAPIQVGWLVAQQLSIQYWYSTVPAHSPTATSELIHSSILIPI